MIFTHTSSAGTKQTYEGFKFVSKPKKQTTKHSIVVAFVDDIYECWYIDNENPIALDELKRFYRSMGFQDVLFQVWDKPNEVTSQDA